MEALRLDEALATDPPEPQNFTGRVRMQNLAAGGGTSELEYFAVYFEAGAHTRPHTHSTDQVLCYVRGSGFIWLAGEERQLVQKRGVVVVPAGVLHMHGATEAEAICHLATRAPGPTDWGPPVPDDWRRFTLEG
jgi:quercetin dioxygenase-like cupin family protein